MRLLIRGVVCAGATVLAGCVGARMSSGVQSFHGHNIHDAIAVLGYPASQEDIAGDRVYTWNTRGPVVAGAFPAGNSTVAFAGRLFCVIQLGTDVQGTIVQEHWQGNNGGCAHWARQLQSVAA